MDVYENQIKLKEQNYYIKADNNFIMEKLGERLADLIDLVHPDYEIKNIEGTNYIASKDLNYKGKFIIAEKIFKGCFNVSDTELEHLKHSISLTEIWFFLEEKFPDSKTIMQDVIKMYIMDAVMMNYDRNYNNWGILFNEGVYRLCVLDNECLLNPEYAPVVRCEDECNDIEIEDNEYLYIEYVKKDLSKFVSISSNEIIEYIKEVLNIFTIENILREITNLEKEYNTIIKNKIYINGSNEILKHLNFLVSEEITNTKNR